MCEENTFRKVGLSFDISPEINGLLTQAVQRSRRTKTMESLLRLEDHLKYFTDIVRRTPIKDVRKKSTYAKVGLSFDISPEVNRLLTQAAKRSKRTKAKEALLRLSDHLKNIPDIATEGKRFPQEEVQP